MAVSFFFVGKGGVGKSTCSAATAIGLAERGHDVVLLSLDPAHNQSDLFERPLSDRPARLSRSLVAVEIDLDRWIRRHLREVRDRIRESYRYLTAFNLDRHLELLERSPGLEEHALLLAYRETARRFRRADAIVVDMPPTALSLRFFALPGLTLEWARHLAALRREILERRELVTRIRFPGGRERETDRVLGRLAALETEHETVVAAFRDRGLTRITVVLDPGRLALAESVRIHRSLEGIGLAVDRVLVNRAGDGDGERLAAIREALPAGELVTAPPVEPPPIGAGRLRELALSGRFPLPAV